MIIDRIVDTLIRVNPKLLHFSSNNACTVTLWNLLRHIFVCYFSFFHFFRNFWLWNFFSKWKDTQIWPLGSEKSMKNEHWSLGLAGPLSASLSLYLKLEEAQAGIKIARRNINLRYADDTNFMAESEKELKSLLMKVKKESKKLAYSSTFRKLR